MKPRRRALLDAGLRLGVATAAGSLARPWAVHAQGAGGAVSTRSIGVLAYTYRADQVSGAQPEAPFARAFLAGMADAGWRYGAQFTTVARAAEGRADRWEREAQEMVRERVDLIVCGGPFGAALKRVGVGVPVVLCGSEDPVGLGLVRSLAAPGTLFTGLSNQLTELAPKRLEILAELFPAPARLAFLRQAGAGGMGDVTAVMRAWARDSGRELEQLEVNTTDEMGEQLRRARARGVAGMLVYGFLDRRSWLDEQAAQAGIGLMWPFRNPAESAELVSYAVDFNAVWQRAAHYVDRILRGAAPGSLPMEQPTQIDLVINLRTAARLGIRVPASLLIRASRVVE